MLRKLLSYRPGWLVASLLLWTVGSCVPIITGLVNQGIFDSLETRDTQGHNNLWLLFAGLVAVAVVEPVLMVLWFWTHTTFEDTLMALVRTNFFSWVLTKSGRRGKRPSPVALLGNIRDDVPGHVSLVNEWYRLSGEAAFVLIALVIMLRIDPTITALTFLPLAAVVAGTHWMRTRLPALWARARESTTAVTDFVGETFAGVQAIKVAGAEAAVVRRFAALNETRRRAEVRSLVAQTRIDAVTQATVITGRGLVLLAGAGAMLADRFSVGDFVLFTIYLDWMLMLPRRLGRLLSQRKTSRTSLERLQAALGETPVSTLVRHRPVHLTGDLPPLEGPEDIGPHPLRELVVDDLSYTYPAGSSDERPGSGRGISDVSMRLMRGTVTVITGEVGSGKSTLLEVLLGLREADSGDVRWNGVPVANLATFMRPPRVAYKPQSPRLFSESLQSTILLGLPSRTDELDLALRRAAFADDVAALPDGLETMVGSRGVRLSGGQVQRAGATRMFVRRAELYVIDDLSNALDEQTEQEIWTRLSAAAAERHATYLIISHRRAALWHADQIIVLDDGQVQATGTLAELKDRSPVVRRLIGLESDAQRS